MNRKHIQCRLAYKAGSLDIAISENNMYCSYLLLDQLMNATLNEVYFCDIQSSKKMVVKRSSKNYTIIQDNSVYLSDNCIECIKQLISQCHLNPYDAKWLHYDIEACTDQGDDVVMVVHLG